MTGRPSASASSQPADKPRKLGRGLSSLLGAAAPVQVNVSLPSAASSKHGVDAAFPGNAPNYGSDNEMLSDVVRLSIDSVVPSRFQPRRTMDAAAIAGLAESIKRAGVMQPVIVRPIIGAGADRKYELVAGERRWRAAGQAGLDHVPALIRDLSDEESAEWALVENVQREDLNAMDRAAALKGLCEKFGLSQGDVASRVGLERSSVANLIRLTELEPEIAELIRAGSLGAGHGKALLAAPSGPKRVSLAKLAASAGWSVRRLEEEVRRHASSPVSGAHIPPLSVEVSAREAAIADMEKKISQQLGTRVVIRTDKRGTRGQIVISFYNLDQFGGLLAKMGVADT